MKTFRSLGLVHRVVVDGPREQYRTACYSHIDAPKEVFGEETVTCLRCHVLCNCAQLMNAFGPAFSAELHGHDPDCVAVCGNEAPWERERAIVAACIQDGEHMANCDDDGFCEACGYQ